MNSVNYTDVKRERVWDPFVRLFHWSLVAAFATAWWVRDEAWIHEGAGKIVLLLIVARTVWGLIGTGSARFENFMRRPATVIKYVASIIRGKPEHFVGHNPAGAAMIGAMLLTLAATTISGILMSTTALWGNAWVELVHGTAAYAMLFLIAGHVLGVLAAAMQHHENLLWSMISGRKTVPVDVPPFLGKAKFKARPLLLSLTFISLVAGTWIGTTTVLNASVWRLHKTITAELAKNDCETTEVSQPRVDIFGPMAVRYDINFSGNVRQETFSLTPGLALSKRPELDFSALVKRCDEVKLARTIEMQKVRQLSRASAPLFASTELDRSSSIQSKNLLQNVSSQSLIPIEKSIAEVKADISPSGNVTGQYLHITKPPQFTSAQQPQVAPKSTTQNADVVASIARIASPNPTVKTKSKVAKKLQQQRKSKVRSKKVKFFVKKKTKAFERYGISGNGSIGRSHSEKRSRRGNSGKGNSESDDDD